MKKNTNLHVKDQFIKNVFCIIDIHISDTDFNLHMLARELAISRMHLHRKIMHISGQSPGIVLRNYRLTLGKELLTKTDYPISDISRKVGFKYPANFSTSFRHLFGISPTQYRENPQKH